MKKTLLLTFPKLTSNLIGFPQLLFLGILFFSSQIFAQEIEPSELDKVSFKIESIRAEIESVKSVKDENGLPVDKDWYKKLDKALRVLTDKKRNLIREQTGKKWVSIEEINKMPEEKKLIKMADPNCIFENN